MKLYSRYRQKRGKRYLVYQTSEGEMIHSEVAKYIGISPSLLSKRISDHGIDSPKIFLPAGQRGRKKGDKRKPTQGDSNWEGLGAKPRNHNLKRIEKYTMSDFLK